MPVTRWNESVISSIGMMPWSPVAFGEGASNGAIDYGILTLNWTANPLRCAMFEQSLVLHLDSESSTTATCYYCGPNLRILCSVVDSERTSVPVQSQIAYQQLLTDYNKLFVPLHAISTTAVPDATVLSLRLDRHNTLDGLEAGVLPYDDTSLTVSVGTTSGFVPISNSSSNSALASISNQAAELSAFIEQITSRDLQPDSADTSASSTDQQRTLLVNYICRLCTNQRKPWIEIFAIVLAAVSAVLSPAYYLVRTLTEWVTVKDPDPLSPSNPSGAIDSSLYKHMSATSPSGGYAYGGMPSPTLLPYNGGGAHRVV